ncbi:MAG: aminotransferase class III-fold pyridoxal phosphate-dependent enzyme, partial [Pirellulales bacterium]|nr:aminotransferase class III-fold pyridoxal phosphate-dependent enzyme [Pirellulales bacterium]
MPTPQWSDIVNPILSENSSVAHDTLRSWDCEHVWHAFTQMQEYESLLIEEGQGATLVDIDGNHYLDGSASLWCNVHGHRHPRLDQAIIAQLNRVAHTTNLGLSNSTTVKFAKRLIDVAPAGLDKVFFASDGSAAVEAALKLAFQFWHQSETPQTNRTKFIALAEAYHGDTLGAVGVGGVPRFGSLFGPLTFEAIRIASPYARGPSAVSSEDLLQTSLENLENILLQHAGQIVAMIVEPLVQAAAGM